MKNVKSCDEAAHLIYGLRKNFRQVQHKLIIHTLKALGVDIKDLRLLQNIHWLQKATVKVCDEETEV